MFQQRKKDFLQRMIDEFFAKLQHQINNEDGNKADKQSILDDSSKFFVENFAVNFGDSIDDIRNKIQSVELFEQYARLLMYKYQLSDDKENKDDLQKALNIVQYIDKTDKTFSWNRTVLKQDLLRMLDNANNSKVD